MPIISVSVLRKTTNFQERLVYEPQLMATYKILEARSFRTKKTMAGEENNRIWNI